MYKRLFSAALVFGAAALAPPAPAQVSNCLPREMLVQNLSDNYGEILTGGGLQSAYQLLEIWSSEKTGSFTVFITRPDGLSCIMATGHNWSGNTRVNRPGLAG